MNKMKKILSLALALVMTLSLGAPALALEEVADVEAAALVEQVEEAPVAEEVVEELPAPVVEEPVVEETAPVVEEVVAEETAPVVEEVVVEETAPVVEEVVAEETAPVVEEVTVEEAAPVEEEVVEVAEAEEVEEEAAAVEETEEEEEEEVSYPMQSFNSRTSSGTEITVDAPEGAFPENTQMVVTEVNLADVQKLVDADEDVNGNVVAAVDISFYHDGEKIQPDPDHPVRLSYASAAAAKAVDPQIVHISDASAVELIEDVKTEVAPADSMQMMAMSGFGAPAAPAASDEVVKLTFTANSFSIYAIIGSIVIEDDEGSIDFETEEYTITVSYTKEAKIPHGTVLTVSEITPDTDEYWNLWSQTLNKLNENATFGNEELPDTRIGLTDAVFFDVSLQYNGEKIEPAVPLQVELQYKKGLFVPAGEEAKIVHFAETGIELIDEVETQDSGSAVPEGMPEGRFLNDFAYTQGSFSVLGAFSTGDYPDVKFVDTSYSPSAVLRAAGDTEIAAAKTLDDPDEDGVYDLSLSVTGKADQTETETVPKANVVLVIDVSGSMDEESYSVYNYSSSTYDSDTAYYGIRNGSYVRVYRNPSDGRWYRSYSNYYGYYNEYNGTVYTYDGTRLEATKAAASKLVDTLMEHNVAGDAEKSDIMEITVIKFARKYESGSYNGTSRIITKSKSASAVKDAINSLNAGGGTNWEAALQLAKEEADSFKSAQKDEPVSIIFMTDGMPTKYGNDSGDGDESNVNTVRASWNAASDDARGIVRDGYSLYNIFAFGNGANYLRALTNFSQTGTGNYNNNATTYDGKFFFNASNAQALEDAFKTIADKINNNVGFAGVDVNDGVTLGVTNTSATVGQGSGTVNEESFRYLVSNASGNTVYTVVISGGKAVFTINGETYTDDSAETVTTQIGDKTITSTVYSVTVGEGENAVTYKMSPASLNTNTGLVDWDLAGLGILENGWTYTVTFSVWPNQWAYDLVADINNGKITKEEALASIEDDTLREQIAQALVDNGDGTYSIRTNYKQTVDYYTADEKTDADGNVTTEYTAMPQKNLEQPNPVAISSPKLPMVKHWADDLQQKQLERLLYDRDGNPTEYKVTLDIFKAESLSDLETAVKAGTAPYKTYTLGWNDTESEYQWNDEMSMAPGVMLTLSKAQDMGIDTSDTSKQISFNGTTYYVLEAGHYYQVTERNTDYHFDLVTDVYHPMKVDGTLSNVIFKEDGTSIEKIIPMTEVAATNTLRGGINLDKVVLDPDGNEYPTDDKFTFTISLVNESAVFEGDNIPWYSVNGNYYHDDEGNYISEDEAKEQYQDSYESHGNILNASADGKTASATLTITSVDALRIANVPINTTYTITETQLNGFTLDSSYIEIALKDAHGNKVVDETKQVDALTVSGEIVPNRENNVTFKNKMAAYPSFYVYHSGDNTIEKIFADDDRVTRSTNEETGFTEMTFNIAYETKDTFLYGGYYSDYAGKVLTKQQIVGGTYSLEDAATEYAYVTKKETTANWLKDTGATAYDGDTATWNNAEELKVSGLEMKPEKNGVYFLKEVPAARFLQPYTHFTFYRANNAIASLLSISDVDDLNYISTGFVIVDKNNTAKVCKTLTVKTAVGGNSMKLTPQLIFATKGATANDYLFWREVTGKVADGDKILNYWVTPDNLLVTGITERSLTNVTDRATITHTDTSVKSTVGVYDPATAIPLS